METLPLIKHIEELFKQNENFSDNEGKLFIPKILESIDKIDSELIKLLITDETAKKHFFTQVEEVFVLKQNDLIEFFTMNEYFNHSYTSYTNKIGLIKKDNFIKKFDDVVLAFPHKDCVLEGGQTKEDDKKNEVFYNQIISKDEIDRLFEPKVLTNIKKYTKDEVIENPEITEDDNLIIKGNNLLALHSLKKKYAGKIKLTYIDPPYNTGNDSFKYNDNFNHSTWLTFMKNRLEIAKELLTEDGSIYISIDDNELSYMTILLDEIFGAENKTDLITVKRGSVTGHKAINPGVVNISDYLIGYAKNKNLWNSNKIYKGRERNIRYNNFIINRKKSLEEWDFCSLLDAFSLYKKIDKNKLKKELGSSFEKEIFEFIKINADSVIQFAYPDEGKISAELRNIIKESKINKDKVFHLKREKELDVYIRNGQRLLFYTDRLMNVDGELITVEPMSNIWDDVLPNDLHNEGGIVLKKGKKPEKLLRRIMELTTNEKDLVLDFHLGSGTTAAVAHKLNRKYIGIEQMDYIEELAVKRLYSVVNGETTGISKLVDWKGGRSFIYAELKEIDNFKDSEISKLNKNMQYLPISEIDDDEFGVSEEEKEVNKKFYGIDNE